MNKYLLMSMTGEPFLVVEAANEVDAEMYGWRNHATRYNGAPPQLLDTVDQETFEAGMADAFGRLGMSESSAKHAARGRGPGRDPYAHLPVETAPPYVPRPDLMGSVSLAEARSKRVRKPPKSVKQYVHELKEPKRKAS